jgi:hypothetical protein
MWLTALTLAVVRSERIGEHADFVRGPRIDDVPPFPQPISGGADAVRHEVDHAFKTMTQLTLGHSFALISSVGAAWLMVRAGTAKKLLATRAYQRCAFCGRRRTGRTCPCAR